ncbi:MAG: hypothetical protein E5V75_16625 [Mesorhizobium sp.]|nr:MAG: hypothetical protein E5V75_16625 [Mesorhizobium sp.]
MERAGRLPLTLAGQHPPLACRPSPRKGGDCQLRLRRLYCSVGDWRMPVRQPISPLAGEMSGRTERGVTE